MRRFLISIVLSLVVNAIGAAQPVSRPFRIWFPVSGHTVLPDFRNNGAALDSLALLLGELQAQGVDSAYVHLKAMCSPEGATRVNRALSQKRGAAVRNWLEGVEMRPLLVVTQDVAVASWDEATGKEMADFRRCDIEVRYEVQEEGDFSAPLEMTEKGTIGMTAVVPEADFSTSLEMAEKATVIPTVVEESPWSTSWYLKTNFLTYPLNLTANLAVEVEIGRHFSVSVPFYYSALNWFKNNIKFRVAGSQPEVRYWFRRDFTGFYVAAHATFGWYNVAVGGRYRYQDHATKSPVFGGGINAGYRLPFGNSRWALEFSLGAGYMPLYYDTFFNVENGALAEEGLWKHYWGPDHAAVTLSFRFGKRRNHE